MSQTALQETSKKDENEKLKSNVHDLQVQLQSAYNRIGELVDERDELRCVMIDRMHK